jgi:magnesium transporter
LIDNVETFRDMLAGMLETYLSSISNRMNEVMKILTIISTIFIPLTFIVGVYGMNFKFMPEIEWRFGYFLIWGVIIVVGVSLVRFFKRKKWF